jgi:hypothetical protein
MVVNCGRASMKGVTINGLVGKTSMVAQPVKGGSAPKADGILLKAPPPKAIAPAAMPSLTNVLLLIRHIAFIFALSSLLIIIHS